MKNNIVFGKELLETITSALYEDPIILFREYVQNSVDAYKMAIKRDGKTIVQDFRVSIKIEESDRRVIIEDNGYGIYTSEDFEHKMLSFGNSDKTDRTQYIGFRGIGRISAMPFCETLTFISKAEGSGFIDICKWEGSKYRKLLNYNAPDHESFEDVVKEVVNISVEKSVDRVEDHYFKVIIDEYGEGIDEVIKNANFEQRLKKILPLKYSDEFTSSSKIIERYNAYMAEDLRDFMYSVRLNDKELRKNYTDSQHILESDLVFWEVRGKSGPNNRPGDKIGILWFTFNKKITVNGNNIDYGILVRSKNVLMGDNDTFADLCFKSKQYVTTYRELTQTLRGTYGELLINSENLRDNARREWFRTDEYSSYLKGIIVEFMRRLFKYRYCSSRYFNGKETKTQLKAALVELVDIDANKININSFYEDKKPSEDLEKGSLTYADEDIPRQSQTKKKTYEELMSVIKEFFEKEKKYDLFLKLRAYIKKHFDD